MTMFKQLLGLCLLASCLDAIASQACPNGWKNYSDSCYLFVVSTLQIPAMSWEDSRANCLGYGGDLVSIRDTSEVNFINQQTSALGNFIFWIGLYRNKTTNDPKEGWIWSDGNNFTNPQQWRWGEPNNYKNNENCAEVFATNKFWNDNNCDKLFASICKKKKGLPIPTFSTNGTLPPTQDPPPRCDHGWIAHNRSCYRFFPVQKSWNDAKRACRDTGGHLVRVDNAYEQHFLAYSVRPKRQNYWIGLNDLEVAGRWVWEFRSSDPLSFKNWQSGEPNGLGTERCGEMYGHGQAGFWNDARCSGRKSYICEKEEGRNMCPEGWIPYNDTCYQFNMDSSQKMKWAEAAAACNAVGNFSSLVKITSQSEQDFITKRIQLGSSVEVWIGLDDISHENIFKWTADSSELAHTDYRLWANGKPSENKNSSNCVMMLGVRKDGAWSVQDCSLKRNFICMRHRDLPYCNGPLGMENGKILDSQITASSSLSAAKGPEQARYRHGGSWCPAKADKNEYLQVELPFLADIRAIVTEGNVTSYTLKVSKDGKKFKDYVTSTRTKQLIPNNGLVNTQSLKGKFVRLYPYLWKDYPCLRIDFVGCAAQAQTSVECQGNNWEKGPGNLCFQINSNYRAWPDARSVCLDQGGDLLTVTTNEERKAISERIKKTGSSYFWISLNDRDYRNYFYWSNNDANGLINWGSGAPDNYGNTNKKACVAMKTSWNGGLWKDFECSNRLPFICMKGEPYVNKNFVQTGPTGMWMSSAKYYWPLSAIDNNMILGTILGNVNGKVMLATGVKKEPNTALQFNGEGSYIDLGYFKSECFTSPDYCSFGLTLSFMASFDTTAIGWSNRANILDSSGDENKFVGLSVYIQNQKLWFVVSRISKYMKASVSIVDNEWRLYVMRWNESLGIVVTVNGQDISSSSTTRNRKVYNQANSFKIGLQRGTGFKSGQVNLTMVAFWDKVLSKRDISLIYKAEFGTCPFSWLEYGMSCYQFNQGTRNFYSATTQCQSLGGDLVDIQSTVENTFVSTRAKPGQPWIGVHDKANEGTFVGTDNKGIPYSNWNIGQPDNWWSREDCGHMVNQGRWNDLPCYYYKPFICEKPKEVQVKPTIISTTVIPEITKVQFICHYSTLTIGCPSGLVIKINSAFWGRREKNRCTYVSVKPCGVKDIPQTTKKLQTKCNDYGNCQLRASETEQYLTNACPTVHKYLEVNYTCVKGTLRTKCKSGWKSFDDKCYRLYDTPKTWNEARAHCKKTSGGELLSIAGNREQQLATSLMERAWYSDVWIGLNDLNTKGVYEWSDKSPVVWTAWYVGQPDERRTVKSCVYMSLTRSKLGWMYWRDQNCTNKYPFMCKYSVGTTQKPTTVPTNYNGNCRSPGWVTSKTLPYCYYKSGAPRKSWRDALSQCRLIGAQLVSIHSKEENEFVKKLSNNTIWLGLDGIGVFRGYYWSADDTPVSYTNWDVGQPDSYSGLEGCVQMDPDTGRWSDRSCDESKDIVCKIAKKLNLPTKAPVIYPTPGSSLCKKGWTLYQGMCYVVGLDSTSTYVTWFDAEKKCKSFNGHLTSINNEDEQKFLEFLVKGRYSRYYWIGLNDIGDEANYRWSDYSNYNYANWNKNEPNDYHRQEDCIHLRSENGKWNDQHCQRKLSYICKAYNETYKPPVKPTPPPRPQKAGYCPPGWIAHAQYCYEFHTDPSDYRNWDDARDACEKGRNSSAYGELASIHDEFELAFIVTQIKGAKQWLWIGMTNRHGAYYWIDNSIANYFNWNTREPISWGWGRCVEIVPYRWAAGRWNAGYCSKRNGYICKKAASDKIVTPTPTTKAFDCPIGYRSYDESCFKFNDTKKTFDEARKICQNDAYGGQKGDLMVVDNQFKQAYLIYLLERYIGNVWIGFLHEPYSLFKLVDHSNPIYTYWGPGQPNRQLGQRSCTQANVTGSNLGVWDDVECIARNSFVCEIYKGDPKVTIPLNGTCPVGWRHYDKYCYKHFSTSQTWAQAQYLCSSNGAHLVSIHDEKEQDFLIHFYQNRHPIKIWTGLNDRAVERGYKWVDNSPLDYVNWQKGEPNDDRGYENCVEMQTRSGQWNDLPCSLYRQYMCKKKLECSSVIPLDPSMVTVTDTYNATSFGADKAIITDNSVSNTAWCTNNTSGTAKIMIDLNQLVRVTGISVLGLSSSQYVRSFRIDYEGDEKWRPFYPNQDSQTTIQGNRWYGAMVTRKFKYPVTLDGLSITPVTWRGNLICMKIRLYGCAYVCQKQLFTSFRAVINDDLITASSAKYPKNAPRQAVMMGNAWCAKTNDKKQWIQFNFNKVNLISAVITFGNRKDNYVMSYSLQFSVSGNNWTDYVQGGVKRIFQGNNDGTSPMRHNLVNKIEASYIRIIPIKWSKNICLRLSLLGCEADCNKPLLANNKITTIQYSSSDKDSNPQYALFDTGKAWCTGQAPLADQYLEIHFSQKYVLTKIATQPSPAGYGKGGEVSAITIKYKKRRVWNDYVGADLQPKVLTAVNLDDKSKPMVNDLKGYSRHNYEGLRARAIRIYPSVYNGTTICMRVELYGCTGGSGIIPTTPSTTRSGIIPTTPSTTQKVIDVSVRFTSFDWNSKLSDRKSKEFAETSSKIIEAVESVYQDSSSFRQATVLKLSDSKGCVISQIRMVFNPESAKDENVILPLKTAVRSGKVGSLEVDKNFFEQKDKSMDVSVRFTSIEWNDKLSDTKSDEFAATSERIIEAVEGVYVKSESFQSAKVLKLSKGSVVAQIELMYNPEIADGGNITLLLETAVKSGKVGSLEVDKESFKKLNAKTQATTGDDSDGLSGGAVAGVVIAVLILVAVAAAFGFVFYRRKIRKRLFSPKHFDNPISYSAKAYDMDDF